MLIPLVAVVFFFGSPARADVSLATVSIPKYTGYEGLRSCAGNCVCDSLLPGFGQDLVHYIGCQYPAYNTCYCNSNIVQSATSFLSSCISSACGEANDVPDALSAWEGYCSSAGYPVNADAQATSAAAPSASGAVGSSSSASARVVILTTPAATTVVGGVTILVGSSPTTPAPEPGNSASVTTQVIVSPAAASSSSNTGAIVGGAVGGGVALGIAAIIITMLILRDRRKRRQQLLLAPPPASQPPMPSLPPAQWPPTEKMPKTPAISYIAPSGGDLGPGGVDTALPHNRELDGTVWVQHDPELDGMGRRAVNQYVARSPVSPLNTGGRELDSRTWRPGAEMDASRNQHPGTNVYEIQA